MSIDTIKAIRAEKRKIKKICKEIKKLHQTDTLRMSHFIANGSKFICNTFKVEGIPNKLEFIK